MEVVYGHSVLDRLVAKLIRFAMMHTGLDTATRHPAGKRMRVMITPRAAALNEWQAPKFAAADHQCVLKHPALLQIGQQCRYRSVGFRCETPVVSRDVGMAIPALLVFLTTRIQLNKPNTLFGKATRHQALTCKMPTFFAVNTVHIANALRLSCNLKGLWSRHLHPVRKLKRLNPRSQPWVLPSGF